jgi:hypothetical protein
MIGIKGTDSNRSRFAEIYLRSFAHKSQIAVLLQSVRSLFSYRRRNVYTAQCWSDLIRPRLDKLVIIITSNGGLTLHRCADYSDFLRRRKESYAVLKIRSRVKFGIVPQLNWASFKKRFM